MGKDIMEPKPSQPDQEIFNLLEALKSARVAYPPELLAKRRAAFTEKLEQLENRVVEDSTVLDEEAVIEMLGGLRHVTVEYPPALLAKQRAAFTEKLEQLENRVVEDSTVSDEEAVIEMLGSLRHATVEYPPALLAKQRAAFLNQVARHRRPGWLETFASGILNSFVQQVKALSTSTGYDLRRSLIVVSLLLAAFAGIMIYGQDSRLSAYSGIHVTERDIAPPIVVPSGTSEMTKMVCTPDSPSTPCQIHGFAESRDQASWVSNTPNSWIKLDLGRTVRLNKIELDRDYSGGASGDFTIALAQTEGEYEEVYDSKSDRFTQPVSGKETVQVAFEPVLARYIKVTVVDPGIVINEVRAFSVNIPPRPDQRDEDTNVASLPTAKPSSTFVPTNTLLPPSDTPAPTDTLWPTSTPSATETPWVSDTPAPTDTLWPTLTPSPTNTPWPSDTPAPTDTLWPLPTSTPLPTDTSLPTVPTAQSEQISP